MNLFFITIFLLYQFFLVIAYYVWKNLPELFDQNYQPNQKITVVIPVRNEAENIQLLIKDLQLQSYPLSLVQVIIMNDQSTDSTRSLAKAMIPEVGFELRVTDLLLPANFKGSRKKMAITQAIAEANGEIVVTTDGDCRVGKDWLKHVCYPIQEKEAVLVAAPVTFVGEKSLFQHLQTIEFSSLIVSGAVAMALHKPNMCNGANLAYRKDAFVKVNGYQGNEGIASGDDEFLLQKINKLYPAEKIMYQKSVRAIVHTAPQQNWQQFAQQRKRWAGKWKKHNNFIVMLLAIFILLFQISFISAVVYMLVLTYYSAILFTLIFIKILLEFILLKNALEFLDKKLNLLKFMILQIFYPFYVIYFGIAANFGSFNWKGRTYKN